MTDRMAYLAGQRKALALAVEFMVDLIDLIDGCPDLEDGADDEPSLSFTGNVNQDQAIRLEPIGGSQFTDLEAVDEDEDDEPTEDDDPGGGNVTDQPHDGEDGE